MPAELSALLLVLDLAGTFAFALNGALTAVRAVSVDIVGVLVLGVVTAVGGGTVRDVLLGATPPAPLDGPHLAVAAAGSLLVFGFSRALSRVNGLVVVLDAAGLGLFAVTGTGRALQLGADPLLAVLLGTVTAVGGGTLRDVLIRRVPSVLGSGLYAIPAAIAACLVGVAAAAGVDRVLGAPVALGAAAVCFVIRVVGLRFRLNAPRPRDTRW